MIRDELPLPGWTALAQHVVGARARLAAQAADVRATQQALLNEILSQHAGSTFGQRHGFARLRTLTDYQQAVPTATYHDFAPEIEAMARGEPARLVDEPVLAFERTGGSTGGPKLIPLTASGLAAQRDGLFAWLDDLLQRHPRLMHGSSYWSISPATRAPEVTAGGKRIGLSSDAEYLGDAAPHLAAVLSVPPDVGAIGDVESWRRTTLAHLLADERLALVSVWSPTFWQELCRHAILLKNELLNHTIRGESGDFIQNIPLQRRTHLHAALSQKPPDWRAVWPHLTLISCWSHASSAPWAAQLAAQFPHATLQGKGLLATEGLVSVPIDDDGDPVAAIGSTVLEFEDDAGRVFACDEVAEGAEYQVLLTTPAGLYRYRLGDRVRVTGFWHRAPRLHLLGRGNAASDLCGEKLTEAFVLQALQSAELLANGQPLRLEPRTQPAPHYALLIGWPCSAEEAAHIATRTDAALRANPQYAYARDMGQLDQIVAFPLSNLSEVLQKLSVSRGQRLGDAKPGVLGKIDADA